MRVEQYERQQKALLGILDFIQNMVARNLLPYIHGLSTLYAILKALKKHLAPTDRRRRIELARDLYALKKAPRGQSLDKWLLHWETTFAEAEKLNLADIQDHKALYDFIQATKSVDPAYASGYQIHVNTMIGEGGKIPTLYDAVERFRNNARLNRAAPKSSIYALSFATLQGESAAEPSTTKASSKPSAPRQRRISLWRPTCICNVPLHHQTAQKASMWGFSGNIYYVNAALMAAVLLV